METTSNSIHNIGDAIRSPTATKLTKTCSSEFGALLWPQHWRRRENSNIGAQLQSLVYQQPEIYLGKFTSCMTQVIMLHCWRVNESWIVDITEFLFQKLYAGYATNTFMELGGDEYANLNFMNFRTDSFKIRKNSWILWTAKTVKIRILSIIMNCVTSDYREWPWKMRGTQCFSGGCPCK